jgi:HemY protein
MLGSLIRLLVFVALVGAATWAVSALLATEGRLEGEIAGQYVSLTPFAIVALLLAASLALLLVVRVADFLVALVLFMLGDPAAVRRFTERTRRRKGLETLGKGLMAIAAGDAKAAQACASRAERLLRKPALTRLLNAQAAELAGDAKKARRYYRALAADPETAFVGVKGLLGQALAAGETERALRHAERAAALRPEDAGVLATLYELQSQRFDWAGARETLALQRKLGSVARDEANRREGALALAMAEDAERGGEAEAARRHAQEAARLDPANAEAHATATRLLLADGQKRAAARHAVEGWRAAPSPALARVFAEIEPDESPAGRRRRFQRLFEANPAHRETMLLRAELALLDRDWRAAREAVESLGESPLSARACAVMAAVARGEGAGEGVVRAWLARALGAPREEGMEGEIGQAAMLPILVEDEESPASAEGAAAPTGPASGKSGAATSGTAAAGREPAPEPAPTEGSARAEAGPRGVA